MVIEEEEEENGNSSPHNLIKKKSNAMSTLSIKGTGSRKSEMSCMISH